MIVVESRDFEFKKFVDSWKQARILFAEIREWLYRNGFRYFNEEPIYDDNGMIESRILTVSSGNEFFEIVASSL